MEGGTDETPNGRGKESIGGGLLAQTIRELLKIFLTKQNFLPQVREITLNYRTNGLSFGGVTEQGSFWKRGENEPACNPKRSCNTSGRAGVSLACLVFSTPQSQIGGKKTGGIGEEGWSRNQPGVKVRLLSLVFDGFLDRGGC